jgi:hypothetical protein
MQEISSVAEDLLDSQEELCSLEFRLEWKEATTIRFTKYYYKTPGKKEKTRKTVNQEDESGTVYRVFALQNCLVLHGYNNCRSTQIQGDRSPWQLSPQNGT